MADKTLTDKQLKQLQTINHALTHWGDKTSGYITFINNDETDKLREWAANLKYQFTKKYIVKEMEQAGGDIERVLAAADTVYNTLEKGKGTLPGDDFHKALQAELARPRNTEKPADEVYPQREVRYGKNGDIVDKLGKSTELKKGDVGVDVTHSDVGTTHSPVRDLQTMLAYHLGAGKANLGGFGFNTKDGVDNRFDEATRQAVMAYQHEKRMKVTGIADKDMLNALAADFAIDWNKNHRTNIQFADGHITDQQAQDALRTARTEMSKDVKDRKLIADVGAALNGAGLQSGEGKSLPSVGKLALSLNNSGVGNGTPIHTDPRDLTPRTATVPLDSNGLPLRRT